MVSLSKELVFLILQFLGEENFRDTAHRLEVESGVFFNMPYFDGMITNGEWEEASKYLSGFTKVEDNRYSTKIFFEMHKQKYLEALEKKDRAKAVEILVKDLKVFSAFSEDIFKELSMLLPLDNIRENEQLSLYGDIKSARRNLLGELKRLIELNPIFRGKLTFPSLKSSRLRALIDQSLNWQHQQCKNPKSNPDINNTLFVDHCCGPSQPNNAHASSPVTNPLFGAVPKPLGLPPLGLYSPFRAAPPAILPLPPNLTSWMTNPVVAHSSASAGPLGLIPPNITAIMKRPRTLPANIFTLGHLTANSEHVPKRTRAYEEVSPMPLSMPPAGYSGQSSYSFADLPKVVVMTLNQGSSVKSMNFHPVQQILLLVGTNAGEFVIWDLRTKERLAQRKFKVWDLRACSMLLQSTLANDYTASVNRVTWTPDGTLFGVAYSKNIIQIYSYHGGGDIRNHLEIEAHNGSVNDLAFSYPNQTLNIVTCGDDRLIKVWNAVTGEKQNQFAGHEAPVYSVCPHFKENIQFVFAMATDGNIKAWLYDNKGSRLNYLAPGHSPSNMAYSADGKRLFSCGTNKDGQSFLVEWDESEGAVKHTYNGLGKKANRPVQFDTTQNRFIVAGDEWLIKYWHMDHTDEWMIIDAEGGLPASPCVRFNKEGMLLAVSTNDNGIKILANSDGVKFLRTMENQSFDASGVASSSGVKISAITPSATDGPSNMDIVTTMPTITTTNSKNQTLVDKPITGDDVSDKSTTLKVTEISEPSHCRFLRLPDNTSSPMRITRLMYTNSGDALLGLAANAVHKLWKWQKSNCNSSVKATASVAPQIWQPASGVLMTNDSDTNTQDSIACFALSKNNSYVTSASGGKISLFNIMTFKTLTTFMPPPPAATFLAFHPQDNNIIAAGMKDCSIHIYNVRNNEVKHKLKGHCKRVTSLAFSSVLNVLVSSCADCQLFVWNTDGWKKQISKQLQIPGGRVAAPFADTHLQFHQNQTHLLVVHETQMAIFKAPKLECLKQWSPSEASGAITHAAYSCDSQTIYVTFENGRIEILTASTLVIHCRISPTSYLHSNPNPSVYPLVVAAHPSEPNQFALGLTDGGVCVFEPLETVGKWGTSPAVENENDVGPSTSIAAADTTDQAER